MSDDVLRPDEIDALLATTDSNELYTPDFGLNESAILKQYTLMSTISARFASSLVRTLNKMTRRHANVQALDLQMYKFGDYQHITTDINYVSLMQMAPLDDFVAFVADQGLIHALVDRYYGGRSNIAQTRRVNTLSDAEIKVIQKLFVNSCNNLAGVFSCLGQVSVTHNSYHESTSTLGYLDDEEWIVVMPVQIDMGGLIGHFSIVLTYRSLVPFKSQLSMAAASLGETSRWRNVVQNRVLDSIVPVAAKLQYDHMTMRNVVNLKVGDVIELGDFASVLLSVNGATTHRAELKTSSAGIQAKVLSKLGASNE